MLILGLLLPLLNMGMDMYEKEWPMEGPNGWRLERVVCNHRLGKVKEVWFQDKKAAKKEAAEEAAKEAAKKVRKAMKAKKGTKKSKKRELMLKHTKPTAKQEADKEAVKEAANKDMKAMKSMKKRRR